MISTEQLRYARILDIGMKTGLVVLIAGFAAYLGGVVPPQVPQEALSRLWMLPVDDYLRASGSAPGWAGLAQVNWGEVLALGGVALLAGISIPCLAALLPAYARRRDWAYAAIVSLLVGVLTLAATGCIAWH